MAIFCLAENLETLQEKLGNIVVGYTADKDAIHARDLGAHGAMAVLLKDAFKPNLVQTLENNPALIHGGPFANIAHGCNSVIATQAALKLSDYVVTEAGFGADLGAEKFFDIKCRKTGLVPAATVIVATVRALKMHGGVHKDALHSENVEAVEHGCANLSRHIRNMALFGVPAVVAINRFSLDTPAEIELIRHHCALLGVEVFECTHWEDGGRGAEALAKHLSLVTEKSPADFKLLYDDSLPLWEKIDCIATKLYGAAEIIADQKVRDQIKALQKNYGHFPVCMAKNTIQLFDGPKLEGRPQRT